MTDVAKTTPLAGDEAVSSEFTAPHAPAPGPARFAPVLRFLQSPGFAYGMILLLQLKVVWRAWELRDLTVGDTSSYYMSAVNWYKDWLIDIAWSPLYEAFYGTLMHVTQDVFAVTTLHRLVIVFLATAGVLAVLRRMLPAPIAWLGAAWWAVLPINFDTLYEVHLFALLPMLAVWLVMLRRPRTAAGGQWIRGIALAVLVLGTFLVRNETIVMVLGLGLVCFIYEWRKRHLAKRTPSTPGPIGAQGIQGPAGPHAPPRVPTAPTNPGLTLLRYALPTLLALLLVVGAYFRSFTRYGGYVLHGQRQVDLRIVTYTKHSLNMAQVYAFGYQQRHPEWDKSPWTDCGELSQQTFGRPFPTIVQMLRSNPRALLEHFAWDLRLTPAGLQVLLFNATCFRLNPDYVAVNIDPYWPRVLSLALLAVLLVGMALLALRRHYWWDYWLRDRALGWAAMLLIVFPVMAIILTQRPRPSYLFSLSVMIITLAGMSVLVIFHSLARLAGYRTQPGKAVAAGHWLMAAVMAALVVCVPSYYVARAARDPSMRQRPMLRTYLTMLPYRPYIEREDTIFLKGEYATETRHYVGVLHPTARNYKYIDTLTLNYSALGEMKPDEPLAGFLDRKGINLFFLDDLEWAKLESERPGVVKDLILHGNADGWRLVGYQDQPTTAGYHYLYRWLLFRKAAPDGSGGFDPWPAGLSAGRGNGAFAGWQQASGLGAVEGPYPQWKLPMICWGYGPETRLTIPAVGAPPSGGKYKLVFSGLSWIPGQTVTVKLDGMALGTFDFEPLGAFRDVTVPLDLSPGPHELVLEYGKWKSPPTSPTSKLAVEFRKLQILPD